MLVCLHYAYMCDYCTVQRLTKLLIADGGLLDQSAEMVDIDARLKALQQFMKHSLNATKGQVTNR